MSPSDGPSRDRIPPKKLEKYHRQRTIAHLEKIGKNLFRMFRDPEVGLTKFLGRFDELMERLDALEEIRLDSEYLKESEAYYRRLHRRMKEPEMDGEAFEGMRQEQMGELNRLQKLKNRSSYRKAKHRARVESDGWE